MSNIDVVKKTYEAFARGDMETVLASMDPKIEWREAEGNPYNPSGEPIIQMQAIIPAGKSLQPQRRALDWT